MKQNKPPQIRTSTSSALLPLHQEWALGRQLVGAEQWAMSERLPSFRVSSVLGTGQTPYACVLWRGGTAGQTFRRQWDPRHAVIKRLLPVRSILFIFLGSVCSLSSIKRNHLQLENLQQTDMLWLRSVSCSCFFFFLSKVMVKESLCFARWSSTMGGLLGIFWSLSSWASKALWHELALDM